MHFKPCQLNQIDLPLSLPSLHASALASEDILYRRRLKQAGSLLGLLLIAVIAGKLQEPKIETEEKLIPAKYAKLILQKSQGGASGPASKAFQKPSVQQNIRNILKGGLTKYSVMSTGRSIQSLSQKLNQSMDSHASPLLSKSMNSLAMSNQAAASMGSGTGFGTGNGTQVKGQGQGQFEFALPTRDLTVDEGLTKEEVAKVIHSHLNEIRYCYESAILRDPNLAGKLLVDFKIGANGSVPNAKANETAELGVNVSQCLVNKLKTWKFPLPRGGVIVAVSYPFIFKSLSR